MRELRVVSVEADGSHVVVQDDETKEKFRIRADERLRAAARGDMSRLGQIQIEMESSLRPREIQARIRAGATVDEVAAIAGVPVDKIERFAHPVLLERSRAAELAAQSHPIREDGPALATLGEIVETALNARGQPTADTAWDAWKADDGFWVVQVGWQIGRSDNYAHWRFHPGAHGGTADPLDDLADELTHPEAAVAARRRLAPVAAPSMSRPAHSATVGESVTVNADDVIGAQLHRREESGVDSAEDPMQLGLSVVTHPRTGATGAQPAGMEETTDATDAETSQPVEPADPARSPADDDAPTRRRKQRKPSVPAWEDVLLGVRSNPNS